MSCRALSAGVRWTMTICRGSRVPPPIRKCHESHGVSGIGAIMNFDDSAPSLNAVSRGKKSASARQADGPTNVNPIWPWQKICNSTTKNHQFYDKKSTRVRPDVIFRCLTKLKTFRAIRLQSYLDNHTVPSSVKYERTTLLAWVWCSELGLSGLTCGKQRCLCPYFH